MKETMMPVNTAERFRTTRTVEVRDVTVSVTEIGIERNLKRIRMKIPNGIGMTSVCPGLADPNDTFSSWDTPSSRRKPGSRKLRGG